jgi:hypothetical protein
LVPSTGSAPPKGATAPPLLAVWIATRPAFGDHLDEIGAAAAHPAVGDADEADAVRLGLGDRRFRGMVHRHHADIVAAVVERRDLGLAQHPHRPARQRKAAMLGDVEELGEAGIFVAAQRRVDDMVGDDARFLGVVADAAHRLLAQCAGLRNAQMHAIGRHGCSCKASRQEHTRALPRENRGGGLSRAAAKAPRRASVGCGRGR